MITINTLKVSYKDVTALQIDNPIQINPGDRIGIIGSNGAGKTTLIKSLLGIINYDGQIKMDISLDDMAVHMQINEYNDTVKVKYIIEMILNTDIAKNNELVELIRFFNFEKCLNNKYKGLSGGEKQRLTLILVLMQNRKLTIFDEVTSGLDFDTRNRLMNKLTTWFRDKSNSLLIVSHYYDELQTIVDKIMVLKKGKVLAFDYVDTLFKTYCGNSVILIDNNTTNLNLIKDFKQIVGNGKELAISLENLNQEKKLVDLLINNNVDYKRTSSSIELIELNIEEASA